MINFNSSPKPTIGVEIELQLVDKKNLNLIFEMDNIEKWPNAIKNSFIRL